MAIQNEIEFEKDICEYLSSHGWLYSPDDTGYDRERALFPADALAWVKQTQPTTWAKFAGFQPGSADTAFLDRLVKVLSDIGTLAVLRTGLKAAGAGASGFEMVQFKPAAGFNHDVAEKYAANRLRVMRQVRYSTQNQKSIDLVLFVNGIPVATIEVKTDFTQAVEDAKQQYRTDRLPTKEPLLTYKRGALVHFAVSTEEVWMMTKLDGSKTYFLPFNKGNHGGKGNPVNPSGYPTSYFWEDVLQRDKWLQILGAFLQIEPAKKPTSPGAAPTAEKLIFPRYHQLDAVTKLIEAARAEGAGHCYLFQHSAGSGKSNTIGWCAHQLSTLHDSTDHKVFDTVIVITDRTILDEQIRDTIKQFQSTPGVVVAIDDQHGSKSEQLRNALKTGALIIVVTLQTFPFVIDEIKQSEGLAGKKFAVIIDEAHSSQSGPSSRQLRGVLASDSVDDDTEVTAEDMLLAEAETRKLPSNASFLAFTATPKSKTLEVFGRPADPTQPASASNTPQPFHLYTMRQAIDEGFILDVLQNFTPYRVAYKIAYEGKNLNGAMVDKAEGMKRLHRWVQLNEYNIAQKVQVIVEHFRETVAPLLDGKAKAMVVTGSRQEAVRYKLAMDKYIAQQKYSGVGTIVAFSGDVSDPESGPNPFSEGNMNHLNGKSIRSAFDTDAYNILIVANKFQTGFDQPKLAAMYVDKRIDGIAAVQTLSRLNRVMPGKDTTFVLDFVNDAETIRTAFEPYYERTELLATTDPNLIYDLQSKLDGEQIYTDEEAMEVASIYLQFQAGTGSVGQKTLIGALSGPVDRFKKQWLAAEEAQDKQALDRLETFHKNLGSFCRLYDFITQIVSYQDSALEARYILYRHLEPLIRPDHIRQEIDLSAVTLTHHKIRSEETVSLTLGKDGEDKFVKPTSAVGTHVSRDPEQVRLDELVEKLNTLFDDGDLTDQDRIGLFNHVADKMIANKVITQQILANDKGQFQQSPAITAIVVEAVSAAMDSYKAMGDKVFQDAAAMKQFEAMLADHVYDKVKSM